MFVFGGEAGRGGGEPSVALTTRVDDIRPPAAVCQNHSLMHRQVLTASLGRAASLVGISPRLPCRPALV